MRELSNYPLFPSEKLGLKVWLLLTHCTCPLYCAWQKALWNRTPGTSRKLLGTQPRRFAPICLRRQYRPFANVTTFPMYCSGIPPQKPSCGQAHHLRACSPPAKCGEVLETCSLSRSVRRGFLKQWFVDCSGLGEQMQAFAWKHRTVFHFYYWALSFSYPCCKM